MIEYLQNLRGVISMILDLNKKEHLPMINMYKKCKGIALVDKYLNLHAINF